MTDSDSVWY